MPATLADLPSGHQATLHSVEGERAYRRRLLELGFVPGTSVRLVRRVEVGDVLEVELRHSRVSLRISEARAISLEPNERVQVSAEPATTGPSSCASATPESASCHGGPSAPTPAEPAS